MDNRTLECIRTVFVVHPCVLFYNTSNRSFEFYQHQYNECNAGNKGFECADGHGDEHDESVMYFILTMFFFNYYRIQDVEITYFYFLVKKIQHSVRFSWIKLPKTELN